MQQQIMPIAVTGACRTIDLMQGAVWCDPDRVDDVRGRRLGLVRYRRAAHAAAERRELKQRGDRHIRPLTAPPA